MPGSTSSTRCEKGIRVQPHFFSMASSSCRPGCCGRPCVPSPPRPATPPPGRWRPTGAPAYWCGWVIRRRFPLSPDLRSAIRLTVPPRALYIMGDMQDGRDDWAQASRWYGELIKRYPADPRASLARFRLAAHAEATGDPDSAASLYQAEIDAAGPQRTAARFWLGKMAAARGDSAKARSIWLALAREDSLGYYGMRARRETDLPPLAFAAPSGAPPPPSSAVAAGLARIDTLLLAGLDSEAQAEVRVVLAHPPADLDARLAWSEGLGIRGYGSAAVRLGWQAALLAPGDTRVLRAIFPWPNRAAVEAEAQEFGVDALLLVALVRQESVSDVQALSPAGARGLAQLLPSTATLMARGL